MRPCVVLVDYENVQPTEFVEVAQAGCHVWFFVGSSQKRVSTDLLYFFDRFKPQSRFIPMDKPGKNSLDFHICFYLGVAAHERPEWLYVLMSKDTGYDPLLAHVRKEGMHAQRVVTIPQLHALLGIGGQSRGEVGEVAPMAAPRRAPRAPAAVSAETKAAFAPAPAPKPAPAPAPKPAPAPAPKPAPAPAPKPAPAPAPAQAPKPAPAPALKPAPKPAAAPAPAPALKPAPVAPVEPKSAPISNLATASTSNRGARGFFQPNGKLHPIAAPAPRREFSLAEIQRLDKEHPVGEGVMSLRLEATGSAVCHRAQAEIQRSHLAGERSRKFSVSAKHLDALSREVSKNPLVSKIVRFVEQTDAFQSVEMFIVIGRT